ncbi:putative ribonuclease H-like domain-containing protein [Tanacetum coccineum]
MVIRIKKLKYHLANLRCGSQRKTTPIANTDVTWGFEHTKACFRDEIIPFVKALKDLFSTFNQQLVDELAEVQNVFYQMEQVVEQHRVESKTFEVKMNQALNENEQLLEQVMSKYFVNLIVNSSMDFASVNVHECEKWLKLELISKILVEILKISVASVNGKKYILVIVDDYSRFTWVKFLRSKDEAPDFIIKFLKMIQLRLKVPVRRIKTDNGTEFVNQTLREYYEKIGISHETSVARSPQQNGIVKRRDRTLIEAACTMLIYAKALLFLWAEAVATACYTQNRSIIRLRHGKTPYELLHDKLPDLSFFHVFGALCYPTNDSENLGKLQPKADIDFDELTAMASEHSSSGPTLHEMTPATISSGLVPNPPPSTPFVPPSRTDWDMLFQPLFDELLNPPPSVDHPAPEVVAPIDEVAAPEPAVSTGSPSSTTVDQDAPSPKVPSDQSLSSDSIHTNVPPNHQISEHNNKWTKDHPLENIIGELARLGSTRVQLHEQALYSYYDAFLTAIEPKTYKDALTQACWIKAIQE